jgi:hypothetical protein
VLKIQGGFMKSLIVFVFLCNVLLSSVFASSYNPSEYDSLAKTLQVEVKATDISTLAADSALVLNVEREIRKVYYRLSTDTRVVESLVDDVKLQKYISVVFSAFEKSPESMAFDQLMNRVTLMYSEFEPFLQSAEVQKNLLEEEHLYSIILLNTLILMQNNAANTFLLQQKGGKFSNSELDAKVDYIVGASTKMMKRLADEITIISLYVEYQRTVK